MLKLNNNFKVLDSIEMRRIVESAENHFNQAFNFTVAYNDNMRTTIGRAWYRLGLIHLNYRLIERNPAEFMPTFAHELAHLITRQVYGRAATAHGKHWKSVMRVLGFSPERTHNLDTSGLKRRVARVDAFCGCKTHKITKTRATKMQNGYMYSCRSCRVELRLIETDLKYL